MVVVPVTILSAASSRSRVEARLRTAGAITPERAVELGPVDAAETSGIDEAIGLGRVVRTPSGRLYLNPAAVDQSSGEVVFALLLFLLVTASVIVSVIALIAVTKG